ncbi:MAG: hypothetical protein ACE5FS_12415 [Paracoccaceae bacterium]
MSFLRPEAVASLRRWAETAAAACAATLVLWTGLHLLSAGSWLGWVVLAAFGPVAAVWLKMAWTRARIATRREGPGIVVIDERRIGYLGPQSGGFADLESLTSVDLIGTGMAAAGNGRFWVLYHRDGPPVYVPVTAEGADGLVDAFAALPGFSLERVLEAMAGGDSGAVTIWRRDE